MTNVEETSTVEYVCFCMATGLCPWLGLSICQMSVSILKFSAPEVFMRIQSILIDLRIQILYPVYAVFVITFLHFN